MRAELLEYPAAAGRLRPPCGGYRVAPLRRRGPAQARGCARDTDLPRASLAQPSVGDTVRLGCHHREMAMPVIEVRLSPRYSMRSADVPPPRERASTN